MSTYIKKITSIFLACFVFCVGVLSPAVVYADTIPGIVEAETIWDGWQSLALMLGYTNDFNNNLTIDKNNEYVYQYYYNEIMNNPDLSDGDKATLINELDTMQLGFKDKVVRCGLTLWGELCNIAYNGFVKQEFNPTSEMTDSMKSAFDALSGNVLVCKNIYVQAPDIQSSMMIFYGENVVESPILHFMSSVNGRTVGFYFPSIPWSQYQFISDVNSGFSSGSIGFWDNNVIYRYFPDKAVNEEFASSDNSNSLVEDGLTYEDYLDLLGDKFSALNGEVVVTDTGELPQVLSDDVIAGVVDGVQDGSTDWTDAITDSFVGENTGAIEETDTPIGKKALDEMVTGLNVSRLKNKFPFCIPNDIKLIASGAASVSSEPPVIKIPCHIEFKGRVFYDNPEAIVINFSMFDNIIAIVREGFFLLFLIGVIWLSIEVMQSFFQITE